MGDIFENKRLRNHSGYFENAESRDECEAILSEISEQ